MEYPLVSVTLFSHHSLSTLPADLLCSLIPTNTSCLSYVEKVELWPSAKLVFRMLVNLNPKALMKAAPPNAMATIRQPLNPATYASSTPFSESGGTKFLISDAPALRTNDGSRWGAVMASCLRSMFWKAACAVDTPNAPPNVCITALEISHVRVP